MDDSGVLGGGILSGPASSSRFLDPNPSIQRAGSLSHHYQHRRHHHHHHMDGMEPMGIAVTKGALRNCSSRRKGVSAIGNNSNASSDDVGVGVDVDDERSVMEDENDVHVNGVKGKKGSMWQRMKWTDKAVRLLIMAVSYVGDDGVVDGGVGAAVATAWPKMKFGSVQKRGKWKMVSRMMMEMGCYVSPQQCEDKFNDLNKRYKRLNEILGRGISCQVVENPILLDSMNHISLKMKNTVRKILSSKHLFYREMCAYHNGLLRAYSKPLPQFFEEGNGIGKDGDDDDDDDDNENEDCDVDWENEGDANGDEYVERIADLGKKKINAENCSFWSQSGGLHDGLGVGMAAVVRETATKSPLEHQDIRNRLLQLHGQRVSVQAQVFELKRRRLEWQRFCGNKDRELERLRLENERFRLENEQMALQLKKKEMEIYFRRSEASFNPVTTAMDRIQGRNQINLGSVQ